MNLLKKLLILLLISSFCLADYYLIHYSQKILDHTLINNQDFITTPYALYQKNTNYYELIYKYPKKSNQALFKNNILLLENYTLTITPKKILPKKTSNKFTNNKKYSAGKFPIKTKITNYYIADNLSSDKYCDLVFKYNNILRIGRLKKNYILQSTATGKNKTYLKIKDIDQDKVEELVIQVADKRFVFEKKGNIWIKDFYGSINQLTAKELQQYSANQLEAMRYEIAAKHGKIFKNKTIQKHFNKQKWYRPNHDFSEIMLTKIEKNNLQLLYGIEGQKRRKGLKDHAETQLPK